MKRRLAQAVITAPFLAAGAVGAILVAPIIIAGVAIIMAARLIRPTVGRPVLWVAGKATPLAAAVRDANILAAYEDEMAEYTPAYVQQLAELYVIPQGDER